MPAVAAVLPDADDRRTALGDHPRSLLVEAGAGTGKTAILAGRVVLLLAAGIRPRNIAGVTFTELAAGELLLRVRAFVTELLAGEIPVDLRVALSGGLSASQHAHLTQAADTLDEITCTTIHGFCQRLIQPYPVEADIDPGAVVMDGNQADLVFREIVDGWLFDELDGDAGGLLALMMVEDTVATRSLTDVVLTHLRRHRKLESPVAQPAAGRIASFRATSDAFSACVATGEVQEADSGAMAERFAAMAAELIDGPPGDDVSALLQIVRLQPGPVLHTQKRAFRAFRMKGKWEAAAGKAGLSKVTGTRIYHEAQQRHEACKDAWDALQQAAAAGIVAALIDELQPALQRYQTYKRSTGLLDFDDLLFAARDLLRAHPDVRGALAERFTHLLVDEFQDTDRVQAEIFWRLCSEPPTDADGDWTDLRLRPGALFLVGDPKQAIYRFRGADVAAYLLGREALLAGPSGGVVTVRTNFRSQAPILAYVNDRFAAPLAEASGQPGFAPLAAYQPTSDGTPCVAALEVHAATPDERPSIDDQRTREADAVADLCTRLIGSAIVRDRETGERRTCRPGDIALLAPVGTDLWRYEEALERRQLPVATQAGKGYFRRQEVQDLIALTRVLADRRDTLALGALLRGPLVGLTEEELLDIVHAMPPSDDAPDRLPRLDLAVAAEAIPHLLARETIATLQALGRQAHGTTPHQLLAQAVDALRVRAVLIQRHAGQAERALANVDRYLGLSRHYALRGLRAFAEAMTAAWTDASRAVEGRPDAQEEAVALYTMHAAKGLEWPIVVPINAMTAANPPDAAFTLAGRFHATVFGVRPTGYAAARDAETEELKRERVRLWYVAATRARDLLVLPRPDVPPRRDAWSALVDLDLAALPVLDPADPPTPTPPVSAADVHAQTRAAFAVEAAAIAERHRPLVRHTPSLAEDAGLPADEPGMPAIWSSDSEGTPLGDDAGPAVQGGRRRGTILHKLLEEVLTGETPENDAALVARADALIRTLGQSAVDDPREGLVPSELAACVRRALTLPDVAELRPRLLAECPVYSLHAGEATDEAVCGIADAVAVGEDGTPEVVIDWKSDVAPGPEALAKYRAQVTTYLEATGATRGLIVLVTSGTVISCQGPDGGRP